MNEMKHFAATVKKHTKDAATKAAAKKIEAATNYAKAYATSVASAILPED
jgi:hypothetical protein